MADRIFFYSCRRVVELYGVTIVCNLIFQDLYRWECTHDPNVEIYFHFVIIRNPFIALAGEYTAIWFKSSIYSKAFYGSCWIYVLDIYSYLTIRAIDYCVSRQTIGNKYNILGDEYVNGVRVKDIKTGNETFIETDGVLIAIGWAPNTELFKDQLDLTQEGYIVADGVFTSKPGVFVAGDLNDTEYRQVITACSSGCKAAIEAETYISRIPRV